MMANKPETIIVEVLTFSHRVSHYGSVPKRKTLDMHENIFPNNL